jgi:hypothetical protein
MAAAQTSEVDDKIASTWDHYILYAYRSPPKEEQILIRQFLRKGMNVESG